MRCIRIKESLIFTLSITTALKEKRIYAVSVEHIQSVLRNMEQRLEMVETRPSSFLPMTLQDLHIGGGFQNLNRQYL